MARGKKDLWVLAGLSLAGWTGVMTWGWFESKPPSLPPGKDYPVIQQPAPPEASNAFVIYARGGKEIQVPASLKQRKWSYYDAILGKGSLEPEVVALLKDNQRAIERLHQARLVPRFFIMENQAVGSMYHLANFGMLDARLAVQERDFDKAFERFADVLYAARRLTHGQRVGPDDKQTPTDTGRYLFDSFFQSFDSSWIRDASTPILDRFLKALNSLEQSEERSMMSVLVETREHVCLVSMKAPELLTTDAWPIVRVYLQWRIAPTLPDRVRARSNAILSLMEHGLAVVDRLRDIEGRYYGQFHKPLLAMLFHPEAFALFAFSSPSRFFEQACHWAIASARFDGLRTEVALELYRRRHGVLPQRLDLLVPTYMRNVPRDPFRPSQPLKYEVGRLWSVGWDEQDDGGQIPLEIRGPYKHEGTYYFPGTLDTGRKGDLVLLGGTR